MVIFHHGDAAEDKGEEKQWVIFDAINLTRHNVELNYPLIFSFFYFWSTATNTFVFPFSFMTITLQDVATILGFPIVDDEIPSLFDQPFVDLRCSFNRSTNGYPYFITTHNTKLFSCSSSPTPTFSLSGFYFSQEKEELLS
uniref:Aminotransferase-like plant mobile domain-containing protein n=1 Tax=Glycine max TaxID=3847 RepID=A0A0R0EJR7_SOYBN